MLISTKGRYALRVLIDMAEHQNQGYVTLKEIAARQGISEKYLEIIVKVLVKNGFMVGVRGKGGGYLLSVSPDECTAADILMLTEGTLAPVACLEHGEQYCENAPECRTLPLWKGLNETIQNYLIQFTIADLVHRDADAPNYVI